MKPLRLSPGLAALLVALAAVAPSARAANAARPTPGAPKAVVARPAALAPALPALQGTLTPSLGPIASPVAGPAVPIALAADPAKTPTAAQQAGPVPAAAAAQERPLGTALESSYLKVVDGRSVGVARIESLFGRAVRVIDVSGDVTEAPASSAPDINVFSLGAVFAKKVPFLGFGRPNLYLAMPETDHVHKFDAKSLKRADSRVVPTMGRAQSGLLVVLKNLEPATRENLLAVARKHEGSRHWTCVNANCRVMTEAGFTSAGKSLNNFYFPMPLLRSIIQNGLELNGRPVEFDLVRTTPKYLENYRLAVDKAVAATPRRHLNRALSEGAKKNRLLAAVVAVKNASGRLLGRLRAKPKAAPVSARAPLMPSPAAAGAYTVRVSEPGALGRLMRLVWGAHMLFTLQPSGVALDDYLPGSLKAFPQANPSFLTRVKKVVLFSRPVVAMIRSQMVRTSRNFEGLSEGELFGMMRAHSEATPNKYNIVIEGDGVSVMKLNVGSKIADWILSKHVLMSGYSPDVRFAGEIWKSGDGRIYVSNNSGTYRPSAQDLERAVAYLRAIFPGIEIVAAGRLP